MVISHAQFAYKLWKSPKNAWIATSFAAELAYLNGQKRITPARIAETK